MAYPAPWTLTGRGIILPYWLNKVWKSEQFPDCSGRIGIAMWVDYHTSPVGPYREWLFIPGKRTNEKGKHFSVSHILVDSVDSMLAGRENWGIPKHIAEFDWSCHGHHHQLSLNYQDSHLALSGTSYRPRIPIHSGLLPFTLYQHDSNRSYWTRPTARGWGQWMKVKSCLYSGQALPDLSHQRLLGAWLIPRFTMTVPLALTA